MNLNLNGTKPDISDDAFNPDKTVFLLISDISRIIFRELNEMLGDDEFQKSEKILLNELNMRDGVTQLDLVKATELKPPTVSVALTKLESKGYVKRIINENDHRSVLVFLDEKGKKYCDVIRETVMSLQEDSLVGLTANEIEKKKKNLIQIRKRLSNINNRKK